MLSLIFATSLLCGPLLYYTFYIYFETKARGVVGIAHPHDFWKVFYGAVIYQVFRLVVIRVTHPWHEAACTKTDPLQRKRYIEKSCEASAKAPFHLIAFVWGWIVCRNAGWLPKCLGGTVEMYSLFTEMTVKEFPFGSPPEAVVTYGLYCGGYHFSEFLRHGVFERHRGDFAEMMVHHICSIGSIFGYILANCHVLGAPVAVLHDAVDIFANLARIFQPTKLFIPVGLLTFAVMMFIWIWTRLLVLPVVIYRLIFDLIPLLRAHELSSLTVPYMSSLSFFCACMIFLHYYWFILLS